MSTYADAIRRQAEDAPRAALPAVTAALWRAYGEGNISEAEAEALSALIELRQLSTAPRGANRPAEAHTARHTLQDRQSSPTTGVGSRPRSDTPALSV